MFTKLSKFCSQTYEVRARPHADPRPEHLEFAHRSPAQVQCDVHNNFHALLLNLRHKHVHNNRLTKSSAGALFSSLLIIRFSRGTVRGQTAH